VFFDRDVDVFYLHVGAPPSAVHWDESPEGHHLPEVEASDLEGVLAPA
jgi:hypothetical protein